MHRFIPFRFSQLQQFCAKQIAVDQQASFDECSRLIAAIFHQRFHQKLEALKDSYAPENPDLDTLAIEGFGTNKTDFVSLLSDLLNKANYEQVTQADISHALEEESLFKVKLEVDFEEFDEFLLFSRGESVRTETLVSLFGLRKKPLDFINYERVVIYIKYKPQEWFDVNNRQADFFKPGSSIIKLFQNVPRADLEMLFPNTQVRMKLIDKLIIGVPAAVGGGVMIATKLGSTLLLLSAAIGFYLGVSDNHVELDQAALIALAAGLGTFGGFLWREFNKFKNRKLRFMQTLTENLYYKNLDNNQGVIHQLIDSAEEEECKEVVLGYFMLLQNPAGLNSKQLDKAIEQWFVDELNTPLDFEIEDSLGKLIGLELVTQNAGIYQAKPLLEVKHTLANIWTKLV